MTAAARSDAAFAAALAAARRLAAGVVPVAGGTGLRAGAVPLVLTGLVWRPAPARLDEVAAFVGDAGAAPAAALPAQDPAEPALRAAGFRPVAGVAFDERDGPGGAGPEGGPVAWDRAGEAAAVIAADHAEDPAAAEALAAPLATVLASAVADDDVMRLELADDPGGASAAALVYEDDTAVLVVLTGGAAGRLVGTALATARGLGKVAVRLREVAPDAPDAALVRWERLS